ncbi:MAG: flagellin [SAR324 cluster bacterium]|nr:flagellin [SAR324 cluster bacterium]
MRVSEVTKHNTVRANLNTNAAELQEIQTAMSNGKILNKPSDDPIGAALVQDYRTSINAAKNIEKNIGMDKVWLNATEGTIGQLVESMMQMKTKAMEGGTGGASKEERSALANEIELIAKDFVKLGNSKKGKLFLFSGTKTFTEPLKLNGSVVETDALYMGTRLKADSKTIPLDMEKPIAGLKAGNLVINLEPAPDKIPEGIKDAAAEEAAKAAEVAPEPVQKLDEAGNPIPKLDAEGQPVLDENGNPVYEMEVPAVVTAEGPAEPAKVEETAEEAAAKAKANQITVALTGQESMAEVIELINEAAIAQEKYVEDVHSISGFKSRLHAEMGKDNYLYIDPSVGVKFNVVSDDTGFLQKMGITSIKDGSPIASVNDAGEAVGVNAAVAEPALDEAGNPIAVKGANEPIVLDSDIYMAQFKGYSKADYTVKVVRGGDYGHARYVVSDDGGESWSKIQILNRQNEIYNPEGKANDKVRLQFGVTGSPFFREGTEFHFEGNEFVEYYGNDQIKQVPIDNGIKVALNITAKELLFKNPNDTETVNTFDIMHRLISSLESDDEEAILESLNEIDTSINQLLSKKAQVGATVLELEDSESRLAGDIDTKLSEISDIEDIDLAKGAIDMNKAELKHKVALDSAARLVQPTLINFLK